MNLVRLEQNEEKADDHFICERILRLKITAGSSRGGRKVALSFMIPVLSSFMSARFIFFRTSGDESTWTSLRWRDHWGKTVVRQIHVHASDPQIGFWLAKSVSSIGVLSVHRCTDFLSLKMAFDLVQTIIGWLMEN